MNFLKTKQICGLALLLGAVTFSLPAHAVEITGNASVEIQQPITASESSPLNMGIITSGANAGTVTMDTSGNVTATGGVDIIGGAPAAGAFEVLGSPDANVNISFNNGLLIGLGLPMVLSNLAHDAGATPSFDENGFLTFDIGAELAVNAAQIPGAYVGTYEVSIDYP